MKKHLFLTIAPLLLMLLSFTNVVADEGKVVIIKIIELENGIGTKARMIITEDEKSREVVLSEGMTVAKITQNQEIIASILNQYYKSGYKIETSTILGNPGYAITTYVLGK